MTSHECSFVDFLSWKTGLTFQKEAVSGTTLVDSGPDSYVARMKKLNACNKVDLFICQLSTNDAGKNHPLGSISSGYELSSFNTATIAGSLEYIIAYAKQVWHCPVAFYTSPFFEHKKYAEMVRLLWELQAKWGVHVIDLYYDKSFNEITEAQRNLYMFDAIHPTKAGYMLWWMPKFEKELRKIFSGSDSGNPFVVKPGEEMSFSSGGTGLPLLHSGWSHPEHWGTWSNADKAQLVFYLGDTLPSHIEMDLNALLAGEHKQQRIRPMLNGVALQEIVLRNNQEQISLDISKAVKRGRNHLVIELPDAISPKELGINSDERTLAIGLKSLCFVQRGL